MHHFDWLTASRKLRFVHLVSTDTRACIDCSEQRPGDRLLGDFEPLAIQKKWVPTRLPRGTNCRTIKRF